MTYALSRHHRKQKFDQWTECHRTRINDLHAVEASEEANASPVEGMSQNRNRRLTICRGIGGSKHAISGQNDAGQESMTYILLRHRREQTRDQWTEGRRTGMDDLQAVKASEEANT